MRAAAKRGQAGYSGPGKAVWSNIHIDDLVAGYVQMLVRSYLPPPRVPLWRQSDTRSDRRSTF